MKEQKEFVVSSRGEGARGNEIAHFLKKGRDGERGKGGEGTGGEGKPVP